jgi:ribose/xylose/arabinose/galactoside ABC-type transport system permease subunit
VSTGNTPANMPVEQHPRETGGLASATRRTATVLGRDYGVTIALLLLVAVFAFWAPNFFTQSNLLLILQQVAVVGIIAIGMTFVILTAGIDLSVGALMAVCGLFSGLFAQREVTFWNVVLAFGLPILIGVLGGAINGSLVAYADLNPLIVTLGTLTAFRGFAVWFHIEPIYELQPYYRYVGVKDIGPIPVQVIVYLALALLGGIILTRMRYGREVYAIGGNEEAARAAGIRVRRAKMFVYIISGFCVGVAAIVYTARVGAAEANAGLDLTLQAIAAVVIGGTSLFGGRGRLQNTVVGTLIIGVLFNALVLLSVSYPIQQMIIGAIIIAAVWLDTLLQRGAR